MQKQLIFYGAGNWAKWNLEAWLINGYTPLCFADADKSKHYTTISPFPGKEIPNEFDVFSLQEADRHYPDADIIIASAPGSISCTCDYIVSQGISPSRVGTVPKIATGNKYIFYGTDIHTKTKLKRWLFDGIVPVCFADDSKHDTKICIPSPKVQGEFAILPLNEALTRYPEANLHITVGPQSFQSTYNYLIAQGVQPSRIGGEPQHCTQLGHYIRIGGWHNSTCCASGRNWDYETTGNVKRDIELYYENCTQLRNALNSGNLTTCLGCPSLQPGQSEEPLKITYVNLSSGLHGSNCNIKCIYCNVELDKLSSSPKQNSDILEIIQYLAETERFEFLDYTAGELTVSPYRQDILALIKEKKWQGRIYTNALVYMEEIRVLLHEKSFVINCSLDAGTAETFANVKGVDCFERVIENLTKYAEGGGSNRSIQLKYIIMEGINCDKTDINGFIAVAKRVNAEVQISRDILTIQFPISDCVYAAVLYLVKQCVLQGIPYTILALTDDYVKRLENDGICLCFNKRTKHTIDIKENLL